MSLPTRECGLKSFSKNKHDHGNTSLPTRECGLKSVALSEIAIPVQVTPYAGVWIEILDSRIITMVNGGHSLRGSVD